MNLKDLFTSTKDYIVEIPLGNGFHLFIEGLNKNGNTNTYKREFDINDIESFCIELIDNEGECVEILDSIGVTLDTTIEELKEEIKMKTFSEAINIKNADIDRTTGEKVSHQEIYTRAINICGGLDAVIPYIPSNLEAIKEALENHDEYLNTIPLQVWDHASRMVSNLCYRKANINYMSVSEGVCLLKEAARQWAERGY